MPKTEATLGKGARTKLPDWAPKGVTLDQLNMIEIHAVAETIQMYGRGIATQILERAGDFNHPGLIAKRDVFNGLAQFGIEILNATGNQELVRTAGHGPRDDQG